MALSSEVIKGKIVEIAVSSKAVDRRDLIKLIQRELPGVDAEVISNMQTSSGYVEAITRRHIADLTAKEGAVWDKLFDKAANGDIKAMTLYFQLTGRLGRSFVETEKREDFSGLSDKDLDMALKEGRV